MSISTNITVAQIGARGHYAVPRTLYQQGNLEHFYTDICAVKGWPQYLQLVPKSLRSKALTRLLARIPDPIPNKLITTFSSFGLAYNKRLRQAKSSDEVVKTSLWAGKTFGQLILQQGLKGDGTYTFNNTGLEIVRAAKRRGLRTIMSQTIAPNELEYSLLLEEQELHPNWQEPLSKSQYRLEYMQREQEEWQYADTILCGSEFVKEGIARCGGPAERCVVIPSGVDVKFQLPLSTFPRQDNSPIRILTIGSVGLRKGSPYVLEAAKKLKSKAIFRMVGPVQVSKQAAASLHENLELIGQVPRSQIKDHYAWADVFLLPSICEGSALSTYEALAGGLPIITTPNTGSIVRNGVDGYVLPIRDVDGIVERIELLISQPELLQKLAKQAKKRSLFGSLESYSARFSKQILGNQQYQVIK